MSDLAQGQIEIYEMIARRKPLKEILIALVLLIESRTPEMMCTILLLGEDGKRMWTGAAPSFPAGLSAAIDGSMIGPKAGSCGTAAYRAENVFVEDIQTDPLWDDYKMFFMLHGFRACWSSPIFDEERQVLGTFAMYFRQPMMPKTHDIELINVATKIAGLGIIQNYADRKLRERYHQLSVVYENVPEGMFLIEVLPDHFQFASANAAFLSLYRLENAVGKSVQKTLPPSTHQLLLANIRQAIQDKCPVSWEQLIVHPEEKKTVRMTITPIFDEQGACSFVVGSAHHL